MKIVQSSQKHIKNERKISICQEIWQKKLLTVQGLVTETYRCEKVVSRYAIRNNVPKK
jgi:hypothetical protein